MQIIAFAGLAQAGKTTAAEACAAHLFDQGYRPQVEQFAGPLKRAAAMLGFIKGGEHDDLYRWFCQAAGAKARERNPDWFVNLMSDRLDVIAQEEADRCNAGGDFHETVVFLDDLRFHNENDLVKRYSGKTVFVSGMRRLKDLNATWRQHQSETMATLYERGESPDDTFDMTISNNDPEGIASFMNVVATMSAGLVANAREIG
jgi:hypothetical protein